MHLLSPAWAQLQWVLLAASLPLPPPFDALSSEDLRRAAADLLQGRLNCSATGQEALTLQALRRFGAIPNSCWAAGLSRALCCAFPDSSPCFAEEEGTSSQKCCVEADVCLLAFQAVMQKVPFESCEDFLLCAAPMFIPCVLWSLEADVHFEEQFAPKLLQSPKVRCFALRLAAPPKFEGPPVLGMDMWLLGVCLPAACDATALGASAAELFRSVPLSTVTGNRAHHIDELSGIHIEELVHWSELKINFGIIGPPNAGTSSLHRSLQELGAYFLGGADEMPLPVSWLRSEESWQWRCTAPLLPPAGWAKGLGLLRRREVDDVGEPTGLVGFRNPKIIFSSSCLRNLLFVPGLQVIAVWRDPMDWLWSSLHRIFEGFENAEEEIGRAWSVFAESTKEEDPSTLQPLQEQGGGMLELSTWRLGVPLSLGAAAPSRALWKLRTAVGQERLLVLPFKELISKQMDCFDQLLLFLGLPASAGELLPANVRRRRTHVDRQADAALENETARLQEFFRSERESAAALLACAA